MKKTFVCGHPINHSRSPIIHNHWLAKHNIEGTYQAVDVPPTSLGEFLADIRQGAFTGGNFTIPHKQSVYDVVDHLDAAAKAIGAVNTVWREGEVLHGGNTDAYGFAANLDDQLLGWRNCNRALVIGAGGASRAILFALLDAGIQTVDLVNRTFERAEKLAADFQPNVIAHKWQTIHELLPNADLIVNTTSLGMDSAEEFPIDISNAKPGVYASDIVYIPLETGFLKAAKKRGLRTSDGLGMLLHQAVPGFEKWYGVRPVVDSDLRDLILADIKVAGQ